MVHRSLSFAGLVVLSACTVGVRPPWEDPQLRTFQARSLERFENREAFELYLAELHALAEKRGAWWAAAPSPWTGALLASTGETVVDCDPGLADCDSLDEITVTGSRRAASITNNQEAGVDEGDIVKTFDRFLIVLQDGRLFSIDTGDSATGLALVDRIDVYPNAKQNTWYDELLIFDNTLVVTGFNYGEDASELVVLEIDDAGLLEYKVTYFLTSEDYYSGENYATRLVDDQLVLYTPLYVTEHYPEERVRFPQIRRWTPHDGYSEWQPLYDARDIYRPVLRTLDPVIHTVSVCPLDSDAAWSCRSTGFTGPWHRELYVTADSAYLWNTTDRYEWDDWDEIDDCAANVSQSDFAAVPAALYRVPLTGGDAQAVLTAGTPKDQFSLEARDDEFLALLHWAPRHCAWNADAYPLKFAKIPSARFSSNPRQVSADAYRFVPTPPGTAVENRFAGDYLVYAGSQGRWRAYGPGPDRYTATELIALPVADPDAPVVLPLAHSAERIEAFGDDVIVDGYRYNTGLSVSSVDLRGPPRIADHVYLDDILESEGRSHAFNYLVEDDGSGIFGLPTIFKSALGNRYGWNRASDVYFFTANSNLAIDSTGYLDADDDAEDPSYECAVSCVNWYGNARPIFFRDRIFALSGTELIEGRVQQGRIVELGRVNMTGIPLHPR